MGSVAGVDIGEAGPDAYDTGRGRHRGFDAAGVGGRGRAAGA